MVTGQIATHMWMNWVEIASGHAATAGEARKRAEQAPEGEYGQAFSDETKASLVAVTASAFALDAWYLAVKPMIASPHVGPDAARNAWVLETLKAGFDLGGEATQWAKPIRDLYRLRDGVVHHTVRFRDTESHPTGRSHVGWESATYTVEAAINNVDLVVEVIARSLTRPRSENEALVAWCESHVHLTEFLERHRPQKPG